MLPQIFAFQWTKVKRCFGNSVTPQFLGSERQKSFFKKIKLGAVFFYQIEVQMTTNTSNT